MSCLPLRSTAAALSSLLEGFGRQHASNKCLCSRVHAWLLAAIASMPQHKEHVTVWLVPTRPSQAANICSMRSKAKACC